MTEVSLFLFRKY